LKVLRVVSIALIVLAVAALVVMLPVVGRAVTDSVATSPKQAEQLAAAFGYQTKYVRGFGTPFHPAPYPILLILFAAANLFVTSKKWKEMAGKDNCVFIITTFMMLVMTAASSILIYIRYSTW